jgi:hypothetical protein
MARRARKTGDAPVENDSRFEANDIGALPVSFHAGVFCYEFGHMSLLAGVMKGRTWFFAAFVRSKANCNEEAVLSLLFEAFPTIAGAAFVEEMLEISDYCFFFGL